MGFNMTVVICGIFLIACMMLFAWLCALDTLECVTVKRNSDSGKLMLTCSRFAYVLAVVFFINLTGVVPELATMLFNWAATITVILVPIDFILQLHKQKLSLLKQIGVGLYSNVANTFIIVTLTLAFIVH